MSDPDFEEQLRQEQLEKEKNDVDRGTYTDQDGTVMEWDAQKKAWFPKIDADFIAQYQLNYGGPPTENAEDGKKDDDGKTEEEKRKEYEKYCQDYHNYYSHYYNQQSGENGNDGEERKEGGSSDGQGGDNTSKGENSKDPTNHYDDYFEYYKYYYGEDYDQGESGEGEKEDEKGEEKKESETEKQKAGEKRKEGWFEHDSERSAHVYVSNLPLDITDEEYKELMSKCGLIMHDPITRKPKLKLYRDQNKDPKGDGLCCYIKQESVQLALNILDGSDVRGHKISVERAQFQMKGQYDPSKKRRKLTNKDKRKMKEKQEKLFDWTPQQEEGRLKCEKTVILKNMFDPKEFEENPMVINELRDDVRTEVAKFGEVKKVTVYDRNTDGVITVRYKEAEEADKCIAGLNGRWFAQQRIIASAWDGVTKYEVEETEEERIARIKKWEGFLEKGSSASSSGASSSVTSDSAAASAVAMDTSPVSAVTSSVPAVTSSVPAATSPVSAVPTSESVEKSESVAETTTEDSEENVEDAGGEGNIEGGGNKKEKEEVKEAKKDEGEIKETECDTVKTSS
ncbi:HIV Tat-specific factor 1-like [Haliotis rubra]|uniref:HIV Tat-specific factor 1-like n=1 Tax=Haliotis rubra TaxID=36100 RepID=UPI001EE5D35F|nr:HIV Tat-specific factor 1-like [Haliotis rubra]XP_046544377.1 HIV Tat-specific factor 1-like [Haliotis rubra]